MADKALIPVTPALKAKASNNPNSMVRVRMTMGPALTGASKTTLIEDVREMTSNFTKAGGIANFEIKGKRIQDLPQPEGVQYDVVAKACTQVVAEMIHPETGERRTATDGCEINSLQEQGFVKARNYSGPPISDNGGGSGGNGSGGNGSGGGSQQAGFSGTDVAIAAAGALVIGGLAWSSSS